MKKVQEFKLEENSQKSSKVRVKKCQKKSSKITVRRKRGKKFESQSQKKGRIKKFAKLDLGLQKTKVSKVRVRENIKKTLQSHH